MKSLASIQAFAATLLFSLTSFAQQGGASQSVAGQETSIPGGMLALVAYFLLWVLVFGLVFLTMRRQRRVDGELAELERRMDEVFEEME